MVDLLFGISILFAFFSMKMLQVFLEILCIITINKPVHVGNICAQTYRTDVLRAKFISSSALLADSFPNFSSLSVPNVTWLFF